MSVSSALQQVSGGLAATLAGTIVVKGSDGRLLHYDMLGYVVVLSMVITGVLMYHLNEQIKRQKKAAILIAPEPAVVEENTPGV